jgi:hypothetical protein
MRGKFFKYLDNDQFEIEDYPTQENDKEAVLEKNCKGETHTFTSWKDFDDIIIEGEVDHPEYRNILVIKRGGVFHCFTAIDINHMLDKKRDITNNLLDPHSIKIFKKFLDISKINILFDVDGIPVYEKIERGDFNPNAEFKLDENKDFQTLAEILVRQLQLLNLINMPPELARFSFPKPRFLFNEDKLFDYTKKVFSHPDFNPNIYFSDQSNKFGIMHPLIFWMFKLRVKSIPINEIYELIGILINHPNFNYNEKYNGKYKDTMHGKDVSKTKMGDYLLTGWLDNDARDVQTRERFKNLILSKKPRSRLDKIFGRKKYEEIID